VEVVVVPEMTSQLLMVVLVVVPLTGIQTLLEELVFLGKEIMAELQGNMPALMVVLLAVVERVQLVEVYLVTLALQVLMVVQVDLHL
jgi:hypothetical protein